MQETHNTDRTLVLLAVLCVCLVMVPTIATADPPKKDHGMNNSTFYPLWSHDEDPNVTGNLTGYKSMANGTDFSFYKPPTAVKEWNRKDLGQYPANRTNASVSIGPLSASRSASSKGWIKDAYVEIFAFQPSTRVRVSDSKQPMYVAADGRILGTLDYRVDLPKNDTSGDKQVYWSLESDTVESVDVVSGRRKIGSAGASHVIRANYDGLTPGEHKVGLEANISITAEKIIRECHNGSCDTTILVKRDHITVRDRWTVQRYQLISAGVYTTFPNGSMGIVVSRNTPWAAIEFPNGDRANGVYRFYSGRRKGWDWLSVKAGQGDLPRIRSSSVPLQTYAYPTKFGPQMTGDGDAPKGKIIDSTGAEQTAPSLPEQVDLETFIGEYEASSQVTVRHPTSDPSKVKVQGLLAGSTTRVSESELFRTVETRASNLTLTVLKNTTSNLTVKLTLQDSQGTPINTSGTTGYIAIGGGKVDTNGSGVAVVTLPRNRRQVQAFYRPMPFWKRDPGELSYTGAAAYKGEPVDYGGKMWPIIRMGFALFLFFVPFYFSDRIFDTNIWPPWRQIW